MDVAPDRLLYVPALHAAHVADEDAPRTLEYKPAGHAVHTTVPVVSALYLPAAHAVHEGAVAASIDE